MTDAADSISDNEAGKGTALTAVPDAPTGVDPFMPAAEAAAKRGMRARLLDYSAHAAMIVGLLGFAWTVGDHMVHRTAPAVAPAKVVSATAPVDPMTDLRSRNKALADDVARLQGRLDALQASLGDQAKVSAQVKILQAGLDGVKQSLGTARTEQNAAVSRLDGKIDKLAQREPGSHMQQLVDRLGRLEHAGADPAPTASLPHPDAKLGALPQPKPVAAALPVPRPVDVKTSDVKGAELKPGDTKLASAEDPAKPQVIAAWVVRDVYEGVALLEGRRGGTIEVVPGVSIPGAGVVKSIDRHGSGWTVTTTKGLVAYAAPQRDTQRDNRRADRGYYGGYAGPNYRYDF